MDPSMERVKVSIGMGRFQILGLMWRYPGGRLIDQMNTTADTFMQVDDAEVYNPDTGRKMYSSSSMVVRREALDFLYEME